jgi:hypothetical protein
MTTANSGFVVECGLHPLCDAGHSYSLALFAMHIVTAGGNDPSSDKQESDMTYLNNDNREMNVDELDSVTGAGPLVDACNYARVLGALIAVYNRPAVEVGSECGK